MINCDGCRAYCCRTVGDIIAEVARSNQNGEIKKAYRDFPFKINADGACEKLEGNRCSVYSQRPTMCNADKILSLMPEGTDMVIYLAGILAHCYELKQSFSEK